VETVEFSRFHFHRKKTASSFRFPIPGLSTTTLSLISLETVRPVTIPTGRGKMWQGHDSCSGLTQLVQSWESLACQKLDDIENV